MVIGMNSTREKKGGFISKMELYNRYINSKNQDLETKIEVLTSIIRNHPKVIDYIYNRVDTCFGPHIVYLVHMRVSGIDMIKMGYTKNSVEGRFAETRYSGRNTIEIVEIIRQNTLQAKAAVDFEKSLKKLCSPFKVVTELTLPGKNEFMGIEYRDSITNLYDDLYPNFREISGLKSPN